MSSQLSPCCDRSLWVMSLFPQAEPPIRGRQCGLLTNQRPRWSDNQMTSDAWPPVSSAAPVTRGSSSEVSLDLGHEVCILMILVNTVLISEHFKVCYGVLKVGISLHRFHVFAVKLFVTSLPAQVKKCWGSICFLICLPAGNQSCGMRFRNTVTPQ